MTEVAPAPVEGVEAAAEKTDEAIPMNGENLERKSSTAVVDMSDQKQNEVDDQQLRRSRSNAIWCGVMTLFIGGFSLLLIPALCLACRPVNHPKGKRNYRNAMICSTVGLLLGYILLGSFLALVIVPGAPLNYLFKNATTVYSISGINGFVHKTTTG